MNGIEDRLRQDLKEFAQRAQPETIRPLRMPAPRRRARTARWLAPVAAAAAVVAVVAGVSLVGHMSNRPATGAPAGMPAYYVVLTQSDIFPHGPAKAQLAETANIYASATGRLLGKVPVPTGKTLAVNATISAAGNDRLFAISGNGGRSIYLLRLAANGRSEGLQKFPVKDPANGSVPELSPDGSHLAYFTQKCTPGCSFGVGVAPIGQPSAARIWLAKGVSPVQLSWIGNNQVMFGQQQGYTQPPVLQYRLLNLSGTGGNLLTESRPITLPTSIATDAGPVLITPDGRTVVGSAQQNAPARHTVTGKIVAVSRSTGRQRVLYVGTEHYASKRGVPEGIQSDYCSVQSLSATGVQPLVFCFKQFGRIVDGKFTPLPGEPGANTNRTIWDAAW